MQQLRKAAQKTSAALLLQLETAAAAVPAIKVWDANACTHATALLHEEVGKFTLPSFVQRLSGARLVADGQCYMLFPL